MQTRPDWHFDLRRGTTALQQQFEVGTLDAFGVPDAPQIVASCAALLEYARATQGGSLAHVRTLRREEISDYVMLDAVTRRNLEITETLRGEDGPTLFGLLDRCATPMGSRRLRHWLHHPLRSQDAARDRHGAVETLLDAADLRRQLVRGPTAAGNRVPRPWRTPAARAPPRHGTLPQHADTAARLPAAAGRPSRSA